MGGEGPRSRRLVPDQPATTEGVCLLRGPRRLVPDRSGRTAVRSGGGHARRLLVVLQRSRGVPPWRLRNCMRKLTCEEGVRVCLSGRHQFQLPRRHDLCQGCRKGQWLDNQPHCNLVAARAMPDNRDLRAWAHVRLHGGLSPCGWVPIQVCQ